MKYFLPLALFAAVLPALGQTPEIQSLTNMKRDLFYLASDECEGRGPGTKGIDKAADYIAKQFTDAGLKPGGKEGYFQPFTISGFAKLETPNAVSFIGPDKTTIDLELDKTFQVLGLSGKGKVTAPLAFIGYGVQSKSLRFDEYVGVETAGKIVILLRHLPRWNDKDKPFAGKERDILASIEKKIALAETNGAKGVILVNDSTEPNDNMPPFAYLSTATSAKIPAVQVKREAIEPIIKAALGKTLAEIEKAIDENLQPQSAPLKGWKATLETSVSRPAIPVKNVIGVLEGSGPLADQIIVVGAHYDHLGFGGQGSLAPGKTEIHHGADDNASGTTAMMELARRFADMKDRKGRKIVFMAFSGEERGLLGSRHYVEKEPLQPLADIAAMVNLDMVGKMRADPKTEKNKLIVQGTGTSKTFDKLVEDLNKPGFTLAKVPAGFGPSDHSSFYSKKIPVLFFWTGTHPDYHKPSDTADRINLEGMQKIVDYVQTVVTNLTTEKDRPEYVEVKGGNPVGAPKGPRLGIIPDYESDKDGVLVGGVAGGGAAEKAGVKAGDRIIEIAGKNVTNIETYMVIMSQQKVGEPIELLLLRGKEKVTVKATPQ